MSTAVAAPPRGPKPMTADRKGRIEQVLLYVIVIVPFLALAGDRRGRLGLGDQLGRRRARARLLPGLRAGRHRRVPPLLHPRRLQGQALAAGRAGGRRLAGHRGRGDPVGGRPPPAPRVQRQGGRPALPVALRRERAGAAEGTLVRAHRLAVRHRAHQPAAVRPRPARRPRPGEGREGVQQAHRGQPGRAGGARRPDHLVLDRGAVRVLLGQPGPRRPAAPRDLVDQLDLPRDRRAAVRRPRTSRRTSGRWRSCPSASPGTTPTTPTRRWRGTACCAGRSTSPPG